MVWPLLWTRVPGFLQRERLRETETKREKQKLRDRDRICITQSCAIACSSQGSSVAVCWGNMAELLKEARLLTKEHFTTQYIPEAERENYGTKSGEEALKDKVVGLFFSASWCPPCQHFVPVLKEVYDELINRNDAFEIIFVSMDKNQEEMMDYYKEKHSKWLALKYGDPMKESLVEKYNISIIPKLVIVSPDGEVITSKGRKDVQDKGLICFRGWHSAMIAAAKKADQQQQLLEQIEAEEKASATSAAEAETDAPT